VLLKPLTAGDLLAATGLAAAEVESV